MDTPQNEIVLETFESLLQTHKDLRAADREVKYALGLLTFLLGLGAGVGLALVLFT